MSMNQLEKRVADSLNSTGVPYEIIDIDPAFSDTTSFCEKYGYGYDITCNTIIVASKKEPKRLAVCVVLAHTRLDVNKRVRNLLGVNKASFASAVEVLELTGMEIGGVTPFSLPTDLPLYVDERVMIPDWVILGGGSRRIKIKVRPEVLTKLGGEVISGLAVPIS
jgi:prolyl-tRNA editing enzyme YbaK/EbsC (Cys-tRNA(Pro) deacylase)